MLTVKMLKPYYIKAEDDHVRVILAYQYFALFINEKVYQFVPTKEKEIQINRRTRKVVNTDALFAFQKGKDVIQVAMSELVSIPDFLLQLNEIAKPYYTSESVEEDDNLYKENEIAIIMGELEYENVKRLIDHSLDKRDKKAFETLVKLL
ncbi:IDEAL domain-containing protein [Virgibacillus sp. DJP39]|uniref:IDEAL domain-containing protein n=1 Tax=Virgibacillus sp. DJP39 TaxID=3409790 RepID=UPI003BB6369D